MDGRQFDGLTKHLAARTGARRDIVKGLAGGLLAGALGLVGSRAALANHKPSHCAHEGEKVAPGKSGKACCEGLTEDAAGRCQVDCLQQCEDAFTACLGPCNDFACIGACQALASECQTACETA